MFTLKKTPPPLGGDIPQALVMSSPRAGLRGGQALDPSLTVAKFKTRVCLYYEAGKCPFGDSCLFAHGPQELQIDLHGAPAAHPAMNPRFKTRMCHWWEKGQHCPHGLRCVVTYFPPLAVVGNVLLPCYPPLWLSHCRALCPSPLLLILPAPQSPSTPPLFPTPLR